MRPSFKQLLKISTILVLSLLVIEIGLRLWYFNQVGPNALLYGFRRIKTDSLVAFVDTSTNGYTKYQANNNKLGQDFSDGSTFDIAINNHGFRGRDWDQTNTPSRIRVVCLGASSTFGYGNRDHETYPYYLEQFLNSEAFPTQFEVINLAIPHLNADEIYNLFLCEGLPLKPTYVTFYEGANNAGKGLTYQRDADTFSSTEAASVFPSALNWSIRHTLLGQKLRHHLTVNRSYTVGTNTLSAYSQDASERFLGALDKINQLCISNSAIFVVANQQLTSGTQSKGPLHTSSYWNEVNAIREKYTKDNTLLHGELKMLVHSILMTQLERWATHNGVAFVDIISTLDETQRGLISYVHLSPIANKLVAQKLGTTILNNLKSNRPDSKHDPAKHLKFTSNKASEGTP